MKKRIASMCGSIVLAILITSCVAIPLFEIDIIEIVDSPQGSFGGATVTFRATFDNGDSYSWDFGDGSTASGIVVVHTYSTEGTFTVRLEITTGSRTLVGTKEIVIRLGGSGGSSTPTKIFTGDIADTLLDTLEFDPVDGFHTDIIKVGPGIYAIAYAGPDADGFATTVSIDDQGNIGGSIIDSLEFDPGRAFYPNIIKVGSGVYAIAYEGPGDDGFVTTVSIDSSGNIGNAIIDVLEFNTSRGDAPHIIQMSSGIYAIAYEGPGEDGFISTVSI